MKWSYLSKMMDILFWGQKLPYMYLINVQIPSLSVATISR
jgi:hypothetical protein